MSIEMKIFYHAAVIKEKEKDSLNLNCIHESMESQMIAK